MDDGSVSASTNDQPQRHSPAKKTVTRELALLNVRNNINNAAPMLGQQPAPAAWSDVAASKSG